jgi:hypothetical protein
LLDIVVSLDPFQDWNVRRPPLQRGPESLHLPVLFRSVSFGADVPDSPLYEKFVEFCLEFGPVV